MHGATVKIKNEQDNFREICLGLTLVYTQQNN